MDVLKKVGGFIAGADHGKSEAERVEKYLQRIADGILPEDRQDAVAELRDVLMDNSEAQLALGNGGFPVLINALHEERGDLELVHGVLECLVIALQPSDRARHGTPDPSAINAELLAKSEDTVPLLLSFLEKDQGASGDFYVRYHTIQLLTALAAGGPYRLQGAILGAPMGMVRLMDLLGDSHEVIRNEALFLLTGLTRASADIQKIAAFEGAFDRILQILGEEGWAQGGIIVQDCLEFLNNLLFNNPPNQLMFRELSHLAKAMPMLDGPSGESRWGLPRQTASNMLAALGTVLLLITPPQANGKKQEKEESWVANRAALVQHGILGKLLSLAVAGGGIPSAPVRTQALLCIERLIAGQPKLQEAFMMAKAADLQGRDTPALHCVLQAALRSQEAVEAVAAERVLRAFCRGNPEGQSSLAATLQHLGDAGSFGGMLVGALQSTQPLHVAHAAAVLGHLLRSNASSKQILLSIMSEHPASRGSSALLLCVEGHLIRAAASKLQDDPARCFAVCMLLQLLITWLDDCAAAAQAFIGLQKLSSAVLELMQQSYSKASPAVNGLAAAVLGACMVPTGPASRAVQAAITARMDFAGLFERLEALQQDKFFLAAKTGPPATSRPGSRGAAASGGGNAEAAKRPALNPFDTEFVQWLPPFVERLRAQVMLAPRQLGDAAPSFREDAGHSASAADPDRAQLAAQARELEELRERNRQLMSDAAGGATANGSTAAAHAAAEQALSKSTAAAQAAEARAVAAEANAAAYREELQRLTEQLQASQQECAQLRAAGEEARMSAAKMEADLKGLSGAYNALEAHSFALEARLRDLESASGAAAAGGEAAESGVAGEEDDGMNDLLMCLGQEEQKVERLRSKLEELGVDVDGLLEGIGVEDEEADTGDAGLT